MTRYTTICLPLVLAAKTPADIAAAVRAAVKRAPWIAR